jgi:pantoate--beta-alanine ligase
MGALHNGHLSLVEVAKRHVDCVVVSIFVNPTQFSPQEDFEAYPRNEAADVGLLASVGCEFIYAPGATAIYPPGFRTCVTVEGVAAPLEGEIRPHHFAGVATVVAKLLIQCAPDVAVFGEKDYQQLQVIRRLAIDLDIPVEIVGGATERADDGLALSSRNAYLTPRERKIAPALHRTLISSSQALENGLPIAAVEDDAVMALRNAGFEKIDYFEVRSPDDLSRLGPGSVSGPARILAAVRLGKTRLIDNVAV